MLPVSASEPFDIVYVAKLKRRIEDLFGTKKTICVRQPFVSPCATYYIHKSISSRKDRLIQMADQKTGASIQVPFSPFYAAARVSRHEYRTTSRSHYQLFRAVDVKISDYLFSFSFQSLAMRS